MYLLLDVALEQDWCKGMHQRETHIMILLYLWHGPSDICLFLSYHCVCVRVRSLCTETHGRVYVRPCMI